MISELRKLRKPPYAVKRCRQSPILRSGGFTVSHSVELLHSHQVKGVDQYDLKQQENVLGECRMMLPVCLKHLEAALRDLKGTLVKVEESGHKEARSTITDVEQIFQSATLSWKHWCLFSLNCGLCISFAVVTGD
ncbi:hypothetical protein AAHA92_18479 [Salvia divinorum]|uniref:Tubulin-specific chaperone A n=1 Tax=Salvia divinorum TaxID=28513 RepID=A0ABD1H291_SALDI